MGNNFSPRLRPTASATAQVVAEAPEIVEDQAALPLFAIIGDHGDKAETIWAKRLNA
jgi:hypothetical protein